MNPHAQLAAHPVALFNKIPWTFSLILYLIVVHSSGISLDGIAGYTFIGIGVFVIFAEFFKSGDIGSTDFFLDNILAVAALALASVMLTWLYLTPGQSISFYDLFTYAIILGDSIISPYNAFRTALRNLQVGS